MELKNTDEVTTDTADIVADNAEDKSKNNAAVKAEDKKFVEAAKYNKLKKFLKIETAFIVICVLLFTILQFIVPNDKENLLLESKSKTGNSSVKVYEVGSPFFFGPSTIRVYYFTKGAENMNPFDTQINNDGAALFESNYKVEWDGEVAIVTLHGSEQDDITYRITAQDDDNEVG